MNLSFIESGMSFGPYPADRCFRIEQSAAYRSLGEGLRSAEFLLLRGSESDEPAILVVEAKRSSPNPQRPERFREFVDDEIRAKFVDSFGLTLALLLGRHPEYSREVPSPFLDADLSRIRFRFVVILHGHRDDWLPPVQDALRRAMATTTRTWGLGPDCVVVLNEQGARKYRFIDMEGSE